MKHLLLLFSLALLLPHFNAKAEAGTTSVPATSFPDDIITVLSGSNTVFLPVRLSDFKFSTAAQDKFFYKSKLYNILESAQSHELWVVRVDPNIYRTTYYYTYWGYSMSLGFAGTEPVTFNYYSRVEAIVGQNADGDIIVLLPEIAPVDATAAAAQGSSSQVQD